MILTTAAALILFGATQLVRRYLLLHRERLEDKVLLGGRVHLKYLENSGFAKGILSGRKKTVAVISAASAAAAAGYCISLFLSEGRSILKAGAAILLGGALGNVYERLRFGKVTDYLHFLPGKKKKAKKEFLVFNLADLLLILGGIVTCIGVLAEEWKKI